MTEERAFTESLGFIFVFVAIVAMAAIVYTMGFADLQDTRDFEQANNAERAFEILATNMEDISERGAPSRATEVHLYDAQLYTAEPIEVNVTVAENGTPTNNDPFSSSIEPIVYTSGDDTITYSNGAIFRESSGNEVMVREPAFSISEERVLMPMIRTYTAGEEREARAGTTPVLVRGLNEHSDRLPRVLQPPADAESYDVTITKDTERAELWEEYYTDQEGIDDDDCTVTGEELECTIEDVDHAQVSSLRVLVIFE